MGIGIIVSIRIFVVIIHIICQSKMKDLGDEFVLTEK